MKTLNLAIAITALLALGWTSAALPGDEEEASGFMAAKGRVTFRIY